MSWIFTAAYEFNLFNGLTNSKVFLQVNNIFDNLYSAYAIGKEFFPAAERNFIAGDSNRIIKMKKCLIIANGKSPTKKVVEYFYSKGFNTIICADGGANSARKLGIIPDFIIGDLDSADFYIRH
ncbi:MAG: hypothetical protein MZV64_08270 [Ignavibacteriales bacterium]|nr:hypothetical protein [Ignavibacteriales bacterium]